MENGYIICNNETTQLPPQETAKYLGDDYICDSMPSDIEVFYKAQA